MQVFVLICLLLLASLVAGNQKYTPSQLKAMLQVGLSNVERETIDAPTSLDLGTIPDWLHGNFLRHACGSFGDIDHRRNDSLNYIEHLFDCFEIGSKFKIYNGSVTFTNKWYDTAVNDVYNTYGRNMDESSVFISGTYSDVNKTALDEWSGNISDPTKVSEVPHVSWWQVGTDAIAMSETPIGVVIDTETLSQKGNMQYTDDWFGFKQSEGWQYTNNPAHEQTEPDGTLWSTVGLYKFLDRGTVDMRRIVYKVGADKYRHMVGMHKYKQINLGLCKGNNPYPDFDSRLGYLHSFVMTENYIILPEAAYMYDPCAFTHYDKYKPFFPQAFKFEKTGYSSLLVMRRSDGEFVAEIKETPFFVTHQLGAYEDGDLIKMDMLMYDDAGIYDRHTYVDHLLGDDPYTTNVSRITINTTDWTSSIHNLRNGAPAAFEMSNINYAYYGHKYTYAYMAKNFDQIATNAITKLNVDTGDEIEYLLQDGLFIQEPQFIPTPTSRDEDDGVIIAQGVDGRKKKAFMVIVDAKNMRQIAHLTAPDLALLGLHARFYPVSKPMPFTNGAADIKRKVLIMTVVLVFVVILVV